MMATTKIEKATPFSCGSQFADWKECNCERCKKYTEMITKPPKCDIDFALSVAYIDDGTIPAEIAQRMGYFDNRGKYVWMCPEVDWTEEWMADCLKREREQKYLTPQI